VLLATRGDDASLTELRRTIASLREQAYSHWQLLLVSREAKAFSKEWRTALLDGLEDLDKRVKFRAPQESFDFARAADAQPGNWDCTLFMPLSSGDELGCDALLELAVASGLAQVADLF
jgi:hypothetical protein